MYEVEYTCIRNPTPVIMSRKSDESASIWNANGMYRLPEWIKSNNVMMAGPWKAALLTSKKMPSDTQNEASMANEPMIPARFLGILFHKSPLIRKPISGKRGTKYA